jgi:hypothetical protein
MSDIGNTLCLWVVNRHNTFLVLAQGPTGTPDPVEPSPILHKAGYLSVYEANGDLRSSSTQLEGPYVTLLAKLPSPDGPPAQTAILFPYQAEEPISYVVGGRSFHGVAARRYHAAGPVHRYAWDSDIVQGEPGYFLIGSPQAANLWRVARVEIDYAHRYNFTLVPVALAHGLPIPDFSTVADAAIRHEIEQHWSEFQDALVRNRYYSLVTAAKNVCESVLYYFLLAAAHIAPGNRNLADLLRKLDAVLADGTAKGTVPFDALAYHLIHKLRILHGRTHVGRVVADGRAISPDLALTVSADLVEVLCCAGLTKR